MNNFHHLSGQKIISIQRLDSQVDYEYYSPYAIIFTIEGEDDQLILSAINDGSSVDINMVNKNDIEGKYGHEFLKHKLNDLRNDDELKKFIGNNIQGIRIAKFKLPKIKGKGFEMIQGKYAGIELKTDKHKLLFWNSSYGGWCDIDDDLAELIKKGNWEWK